jgi:hypothetical protein
MSPSVPQRLIDAAMEEDEPVALAEYGAEFRRDVESYVSREVVGAATVPGRHELPPVAGVSYHAFTDPSGGSADSFALAVAHQVRPPSGDDGQRFLHPAVLQPSDAAADLGGPGAVSLPGTLQVQP